jgi:hypothetical protein
LQIIYAAPFVFLSIVSFAICLAVPSLRRFALPALIVRVTFGFSSIVGWVAFALIADDVLKLHLGPATGVHGVVEGLLFYLLPGVVASWIAIATVRTLELRFLRTQFAKNLVLRLVISAVAGFAGGILGLGVAVNWLPDGSLVATLAAAFAAAGLTAVLAFLLTMTVQRRVERSQRTSSPNRVVE